MHPETATQAPVRTWLGRLLRWFNSYEPKALPPPAFTLKPADPPRPALPLRPIHGNIAPILGEVDHPEPGPLRHVFLPRPEPSTRFEDFNRRLFIVSPANDLVWPTARVSDFPLELGGPLTAVLNEAAVRLRPYYPVIIDLGGAWAWASRQLEQNPDYMDQIVRTYLDLPEEERPVVLSSQTGRPPQTTDALTFLRYGFEAFSMPFSVMAPYIGDSLACAIKAMSGPREEWLWFSVARMRRYVTEMNQALDALRTFLESKAEAEKAEEHRNRFSALWNLQKVGEEKDHSQDAAADPAEAS